MASAVAQLEDADLAEANLRSARQIGLQAALLGILADNVFRSAQEGLGWAIWISALVIACVLVARYRGQRLQWEQAGWLGVAALCAAAVAWRAAETLQPLNIFATLVALAMFSMACTGRPAVSILSARLRDSLAAWVFAARDGALGAPAVLRDAEIGSALQSTAVARWPLLRAILITVPLFIVFTALLSRADPVFGAIFRLPDLDVGEVAGHVLLGTVFAWLSAGWMRGALLPTGGRSPLAARLPLQLGVVEVTTSLGAVLGLFAVFVAIQLRWLFGGAEVVQATTGLSVAEYARRGFFELVTVAALVFPLILGTRAAIEDEAAIRRHARLSIALLILLSAIMASATLRMQLYVDHFGLTTDRLYALVFMGWLAIVFVAMGLTLLRGWGRPFAAVTFVSAFAALFTLNAANPEALVARVNLGRSTAQQPVDYEYLSRLTADAAVVVAPALAQAEPSADACSAAKRMRVRLLSIESFRSNLGISRGRRAVIEHLTPQRVQRLCGLT